MRLLVDPHAPNQFLATKLQCPFIGSRIVRRKRLTNILQAGMSKQLTTLVAPVGYGKTVLLGEWLTSDGSHDALVAWLSLDSSDDEPFLFWSYVLAALHRAYPSFDLNVAPTEKLRRPKATLITSLLNRLANTSGQVCLILDNYHFITNQTIHEELSRLIDNLPHNVHLYLASRSVPPLHLARLRAQGQVIEVSTRDLAFTFQESEGFLGSVMDLQLDRQTQLSLLQKTEGWIGALQLLALSIKSSSDTSTLWRSSSGSIQSLIEYTAEEVLTFQDESTKQFLLQTAVLNELCAPLCDAVLGRQDSRAMLDRIERSNLFMIPLDEAGNWYRYHTLFLQSLRAQLERLHPELLHALHYKAAVWLKANGYPAKAISHAIAAQQSEMASEIIEGCAEHALAEFNIEGLVQSIDHLSEALIRKRPRLGIYRALAYYWLGQIDHVDLVLTAVEQAIELAPEDQDAIRREITFIRAAVECARGDFEGGISLTQRILDGANGRDYFCGMLNHFAGYVYESAGNLDAAARAFSAGAQIALKHPALIPYVFSRCEMARIHQKQGRLRLAEREYRQMLDFANNSMLGTEISLFAETGLAEVFLQRADYAAADGMMRNAIQYFSRTDATGMVWVYSVALRTRIASYYLDRGELEEARRYCISTKLSLRCYTQAFSHLIAEINEVLVRLWLSTGDMERATGWLKKKTSGAVPEKCLSIGEKVGIARVYLKLGRLPEALSVLCKLEDHLRESGMTERLIEVLAMKAVVLDLSGMKNEALETVRNLLRLAEPEGQIQLLVRCGPRLYGIIEEPLLSNPDYSRDYIQRLTDAFRIISPAKKQQPSREPQNTVMISPVLEPLSRRELEVLRLVTANKCAKDIAVALGVSVNTAKAHLKNVYRKLSVHTQQQALERSREMNLLDS